MHQTFTRAPLRRALAAAAVGATALAVMPSAAMAQTADPPPPVSIDDFCVNVPAEDDFNDVSDGDSYAAVVRCLAYAGITQGVSEGVFAPEAYVDRKQMATFIARMIDVANVLDADGGADLVDLPAYDGSNAFVDVPDNSTHVAAINRLADAGIAVGGPGGLPTNYFGPELNVRRGQMASFINRALEHLADVERVATEDFFTDDETNVHEPNINALAEVGIAVGYGNNIYRPEWGVTRANMAAFLIRPLANFETADVIVPLPAEDPGDQAVSDANSTATSTDNENGTAIISFVVRDANNDGIDGLTAEDISLVVPGRDDPNTLAELMAEAPGTWLDFTDADAGNGVYTMVYDVNTDGTYEYEGISALGVMIEANLAVTVTGNS